MMDKVMEIMGKIIGRVETPEKSVEELTEWVLAHKPITSTERFWVRQQIRLLLICYGDDWAKSLPRNSPLRKQWKFGLQLKRALNRCPIIDERYKNDR